MEKALVSNMPNHLVWYEWEAHEAEIVAECEKKGERGVDVGVGVDMDRSRRRTQSRGHQTRSTHPETNDDNNPGIPVPPGKRTKMAAPAMARQARW